MFQKIREFFGYGKKSPVETKMTISYLHVDHPEVDGWYIDLDGVPYAGPYGREKDAKGQLTRLRKGYTPAARKV